MKVMCYIPECTKLIETDKITYFTRCIINLIRNGVWHPMIICPEHLERLNSDKLSDNDPTTNPNLNK